MKDKRRDSLEWLKDIENAISVIEKRTKSETEKHFIANEILNTSILFQFSVMGEAIKHVENEILDKYKYPWHKVRAFRNLIAHEYYNVKLNAVWKIIRNDVPELKKVITAMLKNEFPS